MATITCASILHSSKSIVEVVTWSYWTLSDIINAIYVHSEPLPDAVLVDAGAVVFELVVDNDGYILP